MWVTHLGDVKPSSRKRRWGHRHFGRGATRQVAAADDSAIYPIYTSLFPQNTYQRLVVYYVIVCTYTPVRGNLGNTERIICMSDEAAAIRGLSRRELMKRSLKATAYTAPALLVSPIVARAAVTPAPQVCTQPVSFMQDAVLFGAAANTTFDIYYATNLAPTAFVKLGTFTTDALGLAAGAFPLSLDTSRVLSITLGAVLSGAPAVPSATTFTTTLVSLLACTAGGPRAAATFLGQIFQEPTAATCAAGNPPSYSELVDIGLFNGPANTAYDIYVQPNTITPAGTLVKVGTFTTNAQGNLTVVTPVVITTTATGAPTTVVVSAVLAGAPPQSPAFSFTATGTTIVTLSCTGAPVATRMVPQLRAMR